MSVGVCTFGSNSRTLIFDNTQNNSTLGPYFDNLLFWQETGDFAFAPNSASVDGWIWIPNGTLTFGGNTGSRGFYEAKDIAISGNNVTIAGNGPLGGGTTTLPVTTVTPGFTDPGGTITVTTSSTQTTGTTIGLDE